MILNEYFSYYGNPPIERVMELTENDLDDLYANSKDVDRINIYFHLLNQYYYLKRYNASIGICKKGY